MYVYCLQTSLRLHMQVCIFSLKMITLLVLFFFSYTAITVTSEMQVSKRKLLYLYIFGQGTVLTNDLFHTPVQHIKHVFLSAFIFSCCVCKFLSAFPCPQGHNMIYFLIHTESTQKEKLRCFYEYTWGGGGRDLQKDQLGKVSIKKKYLLG